MERKTVFILYVLHFNSKSPSLSPDRVGVNPDSTSQLIVAPLLPVQYSQASTFPIGYVNLDTLLLKYDYVKEMEKKMKNAQRKAQKALENELVSLQNDQATFQNIMQTGGFQNQQQGEDNYRQLLQREQSLAQKEQQLMLELQDKQLKFNEQMLKNIKEYLAVYNNDLRYSYILPYGTGQAILFANDSLDITTPILKGLNKKFKASRNKK